MIFYIEYDKTYEHVLFRLWLNHYKKLNLEFKIYVQDEDIVYFQNVYSSFSSYTINYIPDINFKLTEKDFLFAYSKDLETDIMRLDYNIDIESLKNDPLIIGKVFYVPVKNKIPYTTFEIPDFIVYQHANHTNYTIDGMKINKNLTKPFFISNNIVCFNMNISKVAYELEYYETTILYLGESNQI